MVIYGYLWLPMVIDGYLWLLMVYRWLSMVTYGLPMVIYSYRWSLMVIDGYLLLSMVIYGRLPMVIDGYLWLSMVTYDYLWLLEIRKSASRMRMLERARDGNNYTK